MSHDVREFKEIIELMENNQYLKAYLKGSEYFGSSWDTIPINTSLQLFIVDEYVESSVYEAGEFHKMIREEIYPTYDEIEPDSKVWSDPDLEDFLATLPDEVKPIIGINSKGTYC